MTDQHLALSLDRALDGERGFDLDGSETLLVAARLTQSLYDRQQAIPSEEFIMQLDRTLFTPPIIPIVIPSEVEGPLATSFIPQPAPRSIASLSSRRRHTPQILIAIAAVLILLLGGAGAIFRDQFHSHSTPEPSAIPAIGFGTAEASPEPVGQLWKVDPPAGIDRSDRPAIITDGLILRTFNRGTGSLIQSVDTRTGKLQWEQFVRAGSDVVAAAGGLLLVAGRSDLNTEIPYELIALDGRTGEERWSQGLTQRPVGLLVSDDRVYTLGSGDLLQAFDLHTQQQLWQGDLSQFGDATTDGNSGVNAYGDLAGDRMSAIDGTIGAIISNGRLVAINASDGSVKWADDRPTEGWTRVSVVDGRFVVTAFGGETLMYDAEATPLPIIPADPTADPCTQVIEPRSSSDPMAASGVGETVDSFDPQTGESPWGLSLPEQYFVWPVDGDRLVAQVEPIQSAGIADNGGRFPCLIDGATGAISGITGEELVTFVVSGTKAGAYWGLGVLPSGVTFLVEDVDPAVASSLPLVDLGEDFSGFRWVQKADGLILITAQDGTLMGFPANQTSKKPRVPATPATVEAASSGIDWIAHGPEGSGYQSPEGWAYGDGRIFRTIGVGSGWAHIQAVDADNGSILWDLRSPVAGYLHIKDDLLLVAGQDRQSLKIEFALVALDARTGDEVWRTNLSQFPVGMKVVGDRAYILGADNNLEAIDLNSHTHLYVRSIKGDSKPRSTIEGQAYSPTLRMAIVGDTLVAVLADGSLVGVELETGAVTWSSLTDVPHRIRLHDVGGHLVAVDGGSWEDITAGAYSTATPRPEPSSCLETMVPSEQNDATADYAVQREALRGIDPTTGEQTWSATVALWSSQLLDSDQGLVFMVNTPPADVPATRSQVSVCQIDPATGNVHQIDDLSSLTSATFQFASTDDEGDELAVGVLSDGRYLALPANLVPEWAGPSVELQMSASQPGFVWTAVIDGQIYVSLSDGRLVKVHSDQPIPTPADSVEPPQHATPIASGAGWIAHGPDGIGDFAEVGMAHVIADGRIFRAFTMETGRPHVQAVDANTGDLLWDVEIQFGGDLMEAAGELLLVNEGSYTLVAQVAALDVATGQEVWAAPLSDYPVAMTVVGNRLLVLGSSDKLDAIDLATGQTVYSVDIRGDAQNPVPSTFRDASAQRHRLAVDGETLYATLADGSVVAVDLDTGVAKWWSLRSTPGQVDVYVIDGAIVTIDMGDQDAIVAHFEAMRDAALSGTPSAIATPVLDSTLPSCTQPSDVATSEATPETGAAPGAVIRTYRGLDANTGEVRWSMVLPQQSAIVVPVDDGMLHLVFAVSAGGTTPPQFAYCFVDAKTGQGHEVNPVEKISGRVLIVERPGWPEENQAFIVGEGLPILILPVPSEYTADMTAPVVVLDETFSEGWRWDEVYDNGIYFSLMNGDLVKIPIPAE